MRRENESRQIPDLGLVLLLAERAALDDLARSHDIGKLLIQFRERGGWKAFG